MTPVRVVCMNTLNLAMKTASRAWGSKHVGEISAKLNEAKRTLGLATTYMESLNEEANNLVDIRLNSNTIKELMNELFPTGITDSDRKVKNTLEKREGFLRAMKMDDIKKFNGTAWQVINAVSDYTQHSEPTRETNSYKENRFSSVILGDSLLDKTHQFLKKIA